MGYTTSTVHGIEVPDSSEANNVPEDIGKVVTALEAGSLVKRLTGAQISALTSPQKPAGLLVYNTTTNKLQISDGTNFANVDAAAIAQDPVGGQASVTTDSSGYANITHGMGTTPSWAVVTWESSGSPRDYFGIVVSRSSTVIQVRFYDSTGTPVASTAVKVNWIAR